MNAAYGAYFAYPLEDGDLLLVDYAKQQQPNDVVIAMHNGKAMVKKFIQKNGQILLRSANADYKDIRSWKATSCASPA
jgi:SOS-response transcriptional repressor LexA